MALAANYKVTMDKNCIRGDRRILLSIGFDYLVIEYMGTFYKSDSALTLGKRYRSAIEIAFFITSICWTLERVHEEMSFRNYNKRLRKLDFVVAVSQYWANYLKKLECKNVKVIYNSFNLKEFVFSQEEIHNFLKNNDIAETGLLFI